MRPILVLFASASLFCCAAAATPPASAPPDAAAPATPAAEPAGTNVASSPPGGSTAPAGSNGAAAPAGTAGPAAASGSTIAAVDAREDAHWVQADDYFVAPRAFEKGWMYVDIAKMKEPAGPSGAALFFVIKDGHDQRSAAFYRTRVANQADLVLGNLLICFDYNEVGRVYKAPKSKDNARPGRWWLARITDLSDLPKGYATLAGSYHCAPDALRVPLK